ncbi:MAG TPA: hypothetical protein VH120_19705, partial [Gemmataceae bacterium]|nr:hypothetical protein [Gemmataceae bacterium]
FAVQGYYFLFALPAGEAFRTQRPFAAAVRERLGPDLPGLALYRTSDIVYYLDPPRPVPEFREPGAVLQSVSQGHPQWLILRRRDRDSLGDGWIESAAETIQPWDGDQEAKTKLLLVRPGQ